MTEPGQGQSSSKFQKQARALTFRRITAACVMLAERLMPILLAPLAIAALFLCFAWFGLYRFVPDALRLTLIFLFVFAFLASLMPALRLRWPKNRDADRFLEERNNLAHQPVAIQDEKPAFDSPIAAALWHEHQRRMAERIASLDAGLPRPDIARFDRWALRAVPVLLVTVAFAYSFSNGAGSVADAFRNQSVAAGDPDMRIDAWIAPPAYTGKAPVYLTSRLDQSGEPVSVPEESVLTIRMTGGKGDKTAVFKPQGVGSAEDVPLLAAEKTDDAAPDPGKASADTPETHQMTLQQSGILSVNGRNWALSVVPDRPPEIAFDGLPRRAVNGALEIPFKASDDYGLQEAHAEIEPAYDADKDAVPLFPLPEYKLNLPRRNAKDAKGLTSRNLTEHPLSGKRVKVTLVATDAKGQTGRSQPHYMTLPDRGFTKPLAASVAEERQIFSLDARALPQAIAMNEALQVRPELTIPNLTDFLLVRSALMRMKLTRDEKGLKDTASYLWEIANGIEDGDLSQAERKLRDAQQALANALERDAGDEEIKKLMDELRKAMDEYMKELAKRLDNNPNASPQQQQQQAQNVLRQQDLENMMDQIENLARSGNKDAAQQLLSELQRMMNNLQAGRQQPNGQQQQNNPMRQQMDKLGELMQKQQKLMEQTFQMNQALKDRMQRGDPNEQEGDDQQGQQDQGQPQDQGEDQSGGGEQQQQQQDGDQQAQNGENGQQSTDGMTKQQLQDALKSLKAQQQALADSLAELQGELKKLGIKPGEGFDDANREMNGAAGALGKGRGDQAVDGQGRALEALRRGVRDMMSQMMQAMQGNGQGQTGQSQGRDGRDPLGRPLGNRGPDFGERVKVPDEIDIQRAREILDAIREKLSNNPAMQIEKDYLERLLDIK